MIDHRETLTLGLVTFMLVMAVVVMGIAAALGKATKQPTLTKRETKGVGCWWLLAVGLVVLIVVAMASPNNAIWVPLPGSLTPP